MTLLNADLTATKLLLPPDAKCLPVSELSARLRSRIGSVDDGQAVVTRPGFRVTTRLISGSLASLLTEFREPSLITEAVLRFSRTNDRDPFDTLDDAFEALATLVEGRILVPAESHKTQDSIPGFGAGQAFAGFEIETVVRSLDDTEVYRARQPDGVAVALKIARRGRPPASATLQSEARILGRLAGTISPNLIAHGIEHDLAYVAMDWREGVTISVAAQQARASGEQKRLHRLVTALFEAYARLHANGVLHGDIHPGNCLVGADDRVILLDFGRARPIDDRDSVDPARAGIPHFYDPEMARALLSGRFPPASTPASEQYAIAVLGYLLLTGRHPIDETAIQEDLLRHIVERPPLPFAAQGVAASPAVESVLRRALAKAPAERFNGVASLAIAFASAGRHSSRARSRITRQRPALEAAVDETRNLAPSTQPPLDRAWFALRAALALEDPVLLAAADVLAARAGQGWAAQSVAIEIARARSDISTERRAVSEFLAAAQPLAGGAEAIAAVLAAAQSLNCPVFPNQARTPLSIWAAERLAQLMPLSWTPSETIPLTHAALLLCRAGVISAPPVLMERLEKLANAQEGDPWLWAVAHDVYADQRFSALALAARRPRIPVVRGFALLRLHQLTGDLRWVAAARRLRTEPWETDDSAALLLIELHAAERTSLPAFLLSRFRQGQSFAA